MRTHGWVVGWVVGCASLWDGVPSGWCSILGMGPHRWPLAYPRVSNCNGVVNTIQHKIIWGIMQHMARPCAPTGTRSNHDDNDEDAPHGAKRPFQVTCSKII